MPAKSVAQLSKELKLSARLARLPYRVTSEEARKALGFGTAINPPDFSGIAFPGFDLRGKARDVYQVRRDNDFSLLSRYFPRPKSLGPNCADART